MADEADRAQQDLDAYQANLDTKYDIPPGAPGYCDMCGEWSGRLITGCCAPCRDKWGLK